MHLFNLEQFIKCWQIFLELNSKGPYQSSGKENESCCLVFPSWTKRDIRQFHINVIVHYDGREMYKQAWCTYKVIFCQSKPIAFLSFSWLLPSLLLNLPINSDKKKKKFLLQGPSLWEITCDPSLWNFLIKLLPQKNILSFDYCVFLSPE